MLAVRMKINDFEINPVTIGLPMHCCDHFYCCICIISVKSLPIFTLYRGDHHKRVVIWVGNHFIWF